MKLRAINLLQNKPLVSDDALSEHEISPPSSSRTLSSEQQIALIRQPGGWQADIGEEVLSALVRLPHWPARRTLSVNENNREIFRYGTGGRITEPSGLQDIVLLRIDGYYQSAGDFYAGIKPDGDSLFLAVIYGLRENIYTNSTEMTQQVLTWRHRVADYLLEQERERSFLAGATQTPDGTENAACRGEKRRRNMAINNDVPVKKKAVNQIDYRFWYSVSKWPEEDKEIYKMYFSNILRKYHRIKCCLRDTRYFFTQNSITELEISFFSLYDKLTSKIARDATIILLHELNKEVSKSERDVVLRIYPTHPAFVSMPQTGELPFPDDTTARVYGLIRPERWPPVDLKIQQTQFPDISLCLVRIIESVEKRQVLSPRQIDEAEIKLWFLYYQLQSALAKNDISRALHELQDKLKESRQSLKPFFLPKYIYQDHEFSLDVKCMDFTQQKFTRKNFTAWTKEDKDKQYKNFPSFVINLIGIRKKIKSNDEINYQKRITSFESKLLSLYQQVSDQQAKNDIISVLCELKELIRKSGKNLVLRHLPGDIDSRENSSFYGSVAQLSRDMTSEASGLGAILSESGMEVHHPEEHFTREKINMWPKFDQYRQQILFPDVIEKFFLIKETLKQPQKDFYQQWINLFEKRVLVLYSKVMSRRAEHDIISLLRELEEVIRQSGRELVLQQFQHITKNGSDTLFPDNEGQVQQSTSASHTLTLPELATTGYPAPETTASQEGVTRSGADPQPVAALPHSDVVEMASVQKEMAHLLALAENLLAPRSPSGPQPVSSPEVLSDPQEKHFPDNEGPVQQDTSASHALTLPESATTGYPAPETTAPQGGVTRSWPDPQPVAALPHSDAVEMTFVQKEMAHLLASPELTENLSAPGSPSDPQMLSELEAMFFPDNEGQAQQDTSARHILTLPESVTTGYPAPQTTASQEAVTWSWFDPQPVVASQHSGAVAEVADPEEIPQQELARLLEILEQPEDGLLPGQDN